MNKETIKILSQGESINREFKECYNKIGNSVYETVCAFLNTKGGDIFLGVKDNKKIVGINKEYISLIKQDFVNSVNNQSKLSPAFCLSVEEVYIEDKVILHVFVPEGSQVYRCGSRIFIRNNSGDFDITNNNQEVANLYIRKQSSYSENRIFSAVKMSDLRKDLIDKVRKLANIQNNDNQWKGMSDKDILKESSLYQKDLATGKEGFTLAGILLFGRDDVIAAAAPGFSIDLIKRVDNPDRYDDRVDLRTNLIDSYEQAMEFVVKHLPDPFYMEETGQRISLRSNIFRELIANIIVHKEYLGREPTRFIIEKDRILTENSNRPYINGIMNLSNLVPHPKNPNIARLFRQIGRVEKLGSGVRKLYKFCKLYSGYDPVISDENVFKFSLRIDF